MQTIAVLLTVHNRKEDTLNCLRCLYNQLNIDKYEVDTYLTNDGCTDGTPETVKKEFPQVIIINALGNLFWNRGMYKAWKYSIKAKNYDFYVWLNDDTYIFKNTLYQLLKTSIKMKDKCIIVGSTCASNNHNIVTYGGRNKKGLIIPSSDLQYCDYFNGNIVLFPRYVFNIVGMNDPKFHHALGDLDYGLRASKKGIRSVIAPNILGECNLHENLSTWCNPDKSLVKRWKAFRSPLGQNPEEFFIFEYRHNGIKAAILHYITNHLRVLFPRLWE